MSWTVTIGGQTFTNANVDGTAYADEVTGFPAIISAMANEAAFLKGVGNTSTTSMTPGTGTKTLTLDQTPGFSVGMLAAAQSVSDPSHYMVGSVAAINGADIDIAVTIASGGSSKSDWVITYPVPGTITDANGDLAISTGSIWTTASDQDFAAGGNRSFMDLAGGNARLGSVTGGGGGVGVQIISSGAAAITIDSGSTITFNGPTQLTAGILGQTHDWGTLSSGTATTSWLDDETQKLTAGGAFTFNFNNPPSATQSYVKTVVVTQDGTGGRVITFQRAGVTTNIKWLTAKPNWAAQAAGVVTRVVGQYVGGWLYLHGNEDIQA